MDEAIFIIPVIEVRETFTPSDRLRDILLETLIDPELDRRTKESLRATFLFKSWRRRVMSRDDYYYNEREKHGTIYEAHQRLKSAEKRPLMFNGELGLSRGRRGNRLAFKAIDSSQLLMANEILDSVPTIEDAVNSTRGKDIFFVDIPERNIVKSPRQIADGLQEIHEQLVHPAVMRHYYITPKDIVTLEVMKRIGRAGSQSENRVN
jgi:hypothetical protein